MLSVWRGSSSDLLSKNRRLEIKKASGKGGFFSTNKNDALVTTSHEVNVILQLFPVTASS